MWLVLSVLMLSFTLSASPVLLFGTVEANEGREGGIAYYLSATGTGVSISIGGGTQGNAGRADGTLIPPAQILSGQPGLDIRLGEGAGEATIGEITSNLFEVNFTAPLNFLNYQTWDGTLSLYSSTGSILASVPVHTVALIGPLQNCFDPSSSCHSSPFGQERIDVLNPAVPEPSTFTLALGALAVIRSIYRKKAG